MSSFTNINSTFGDDDDFMQQYNSLPAEYQRIIAPYLQYSYRPGFIDNIFGDTFRTGAVRAREQAQAAAREMMSKIQAEIQQNNLNSPQMQVARQKDAGLNSDLLGTEGVEGASEMDQPTITPTLPQLEPQDLSKQILDTLNGALSLAQGGIQVQDVLSQLHLRRLSTEAQDIANADDMMKYIVDKYSHIEPKSLQEAIESGKLEFGNLPEYSVMKEDGTFDGGSLDTAVTSIVPDFHTKDAEKRYKSIIHNLKNSPQVRDAFYKAQNEMFNSRRQNQIQRANKFTLEDTDAVNDVNMKFLTRCEEARMSYQAEVDYATPKLQAAMTGNEQARQELIAKYKLPEETVAADLQTAIAAKLKAQYDQDYWNAQKEELAYLKQLYDKGNTWAGYVYQYKLTQMPLPSLQQLAGYGVSNVSDAATNIFQQADGALSRLFGL